jgi:hypothetical protein
MCLLLFLQRFSLLVAVKDIFNAGMNIFPTLVTNLALMLYIFSSPYNAIK